MDFRFQGSRSQVYGLRVDGLGSSAWDIGFRVEGRGFRTYPLGPWTTMLTPFSTERSRFFTISFPCGSRHVTWLGIY